MPAFYLIGHPLGHSMSPFLHERLFASGKLDGATYQLCDIEPDSLAETVARFRREAVGCNVTIPYKQAVIPHLDRLDTSAARYGAVNTVAFGPDGAAVGYNTDGAGFRYALKAADIDLTGRVAVIGCGGAARVFLCEAAAEGCSIVNAVLPDCIEAAEQLAAFVKTTVADVPYTVTTSTDLCGDFDLVINATPVGMFPRVDAMPIDLNRVRTAAVFDAIYNPRETALIKAAKAAGAKVAGGMAMLVKQAAVAEEIWVGASFDDTIIDQLTEAAYTAMAEGKFG